MNTIKSFSKPPFEFILSDGNHFIITRDGISMLLARKQADGKWLLPDCNLYKDDYFLLTHNFGQDTDTFVEEDKTFDTFGDLWVYLSNMIDGLSEAMWEDQAKEYVNSLNALFGGVK